jgi:hypothetical protein
MDPILNWTERRSVAYPNVGQDFLEREKGKIIRFPKSYLCIMDPASNPRKRSPSPVRHTRQEEPVKSTRRRKDGFVYTSDLPIPPSFFFSENPQFFSCFGFGKKSKLVFPCRLLPHYQLPIIGA